MKDILIYDDIGETFFSAGVTAKQVKDELDQAINEGHSGVNVRINSPGGSLFEGLAIFNILNAASKNSISVEVTIDGLAASAASIIALAGEKISIADNALIMIHDPWTFVIGNKADLEKEMSVLDTLKDSILNIYEKNTVLDRTELSEMMANETWINSGEAIANGFVNEVINSNNAQNTMNLSRPWLNKIPEPGFVNEDVEKQSSYRVALKRRAMRLIDK